MDLLSIELWQTVIDVIAVFLCGAVILFAINNRSECKHLLLAGPNLFSNDKKSLIKSNYICDRYEEVSRLACLQMSIKEISEKVRMPRGEIELALKFQGLVRGPYQEGRIEAQV